MKISTPAHVSGHWTVIEEAVDGKKEGNNANTHPALCNLAEMYIAGLHAVGNVNCGLW